MSLLETYTQKENVLKQEVVKMRKKAQRVHHQLKTLHKQKRKRKNNMGSLGKILADILRRRL